MNEISVGLGESAGLCRVFSKLSSSRSTPPIGGDYARTLHNPTHPTLQWFQLGMALSISLHKITFCVMLCLLRSRIINRISHGKSPC
jgi:hypothetical protein